MVEETYQRIAGRSTGWHRKEDGANARRVLATLDSMAASGRLNGAGPVEALERSLRVWLLLDQRARADGYPLELWWARWERCLSMAWCQWPLPPEFADACLQFAARTGLPAFTVAERALEATSGGVDLVSMTGALRAAAHGGEWKALGRALADAHARAESRRLQQQEVPPW